MSVEGRLLISDRAHMLFELHKEIDGAREAELAGTGKQVWWWACWIQGMGCDIAPRSSSKLREALRLLPCARSKLTWCSRDYRAF